jgi:large subunit ribosomal protein L24
MHVRRDDIVEVITGNDAGARKKVLRVLPKEGKVIVEGVNRVLKHLRPSRANPQGGRLSKEMPIDASNVLKYCERCGRGVRVGYRFTDSGEKERYCRKCSSSLGTVSSARGSRRKS